MSDVARFWEWYDRVRKEAPLTEVGKRRGLPRRAYGRRLPVLGKVDARWPLPVDLRH
jgi:hypothetical protein